MKLVLLCLAISFAAALFLMRGPLRASSGYANDFAAPYISARLWLNHQDPYDPAAFWPTWRTAGAPLTQPDGAPLYANPSSTHSIYPPPSIVVLAPFALLPWSAAWLSMILLSTVLYLSALLLLARLLPGAWSDPYKPAFLAFGLLLAPTQSALHVSNVTCLSAGLLLIAVNLLFNTDNTTTPGTQSSASGTSALPTAKSLSIAALLALSLCIKPTLALIVLIYLLRARHWKILAATLTLSSLATVAFLLREPNWNWLPSIRSNIDLLFTTGVASLYPQNLTRTDRIDLQLPFFNLTHSANAAAVLATAVTIILLALWLQSTRQNIPTTINAAAPHTIFDHKLLTLSTLLVIGLLPAYQRFYSAILLLLPALWAIRNLNLPPARWSLALCSVFLVNTSVLPRRLGIHLPSSGSLPWVFDILLAPHLCWLILLLAAVLVSALHRSSSHHAEPKTP